MAQNKIELQLKVLRKKAREIECNSVDKWRFAQEPRGDIKYPSSYYSLLGKIKQLENKLSKLRTDN